MWIVPYILSKSSPTTKFPLTSAWIFLTDGGTAVWQTESIESEETEQKECADTVYKEYCVENGLLGTPFYSERLDTLFIKIDTTQTKLSDFYLWSDFLQKSQTPPADSQVWRPFFWLGPSTAPADSFGWRVCADKTVLGSFGPVTQLWDIFLSAEQTV